MSNYYLAPRIKDSDYSKKFGWPIYLRFSYRGEISWKATGVYIKEKKYWLDNIKKVVDGPNIKPKNDIIEKKMNEAEARLSKAIVDGDGPNIKAFQGITLKSLEDYINKKCAANLASGAIKHIKAFHGKVPDITHITVKWLRNLEDYMFGVADLENNSVVGYMGGVLRKVLNHAVEEGYITRSPIGDGGYHVPKIGETKPEYLVNHEVDLMLKELFSGKNYTGEAYRVLAYFCLACRTGLRFSDWELFDYASNIKGNELVVQARKNRKIIVQPIQNNTDLKDILPIIKRIGPLNVPYYKVLNYLDDFAKYFKFKKEIGTHVGKHSFGYYLASKAIPKETAARLMGNSVKVIEIYYHLTGEHVREQSKKLRRA